MFKTDFIEHSTLVIFFEQLNLLNPFSPFSNLSNHSTHKTYVESTLHIEGVFVSLSCQVFVYVSVLHSTKQGNYVIIYMDVNLTIQQKHVQVLTVSRINLKPSVKC
jgi:hypothetical protein